MIFPNPFSNEVSIEVQERQSLSIFDIRGSLIRESQLESGTNTLHTLDLEPGLYTFKLAGSSGIKIKRFVKIE